MPDGPAALAEEDAKLVALARGARARAGAPEAGALRDTTGRSWAAGAVALPSLALSGLQAAVAAAAGSGVDGLEAAVLVTAVGQVDDAGLAAVRDLGGPGVPVHLVAPDGAVVASLTT